MSTKPVTDEEKKARQDYLKQQADQKKAARPAAPARAPAGGGLRGVFAPRDTGRPIEFAQLEGDSRGGGRGFIEGDGGRGAPGFSNSSVQSNNEALNKLAATVPQGPFDPQQATPKLADIDIVAHDDTAEPGKTYRYHIRYQIYNPLRGRPDIVKNPKLATVFAIPSAYSDWTKPVSVPSVLNFFVNAGPSPRTGEVSMKIYKWEKGVTTAVVQKFVPGDVIGKPANGIDYSTLFTLVDVRADHGDVYVLLADPSGKLIKRDYSNDAKDPANTRLENEVKSATPAAGAPGAPTASMQ